VDSNNHNATIFQESDDWWIQIGNGRGLDVVPAVEMAVRFMKVGETAIVWAHSKYAYGRMTRLSSSVATTTTTTGSSPYTLPPESNVAYQITVKEKVNVSSNNNNENTTLALAQARKRQINDMYQYEWSNGDNVLRIVQAYQRIAQDTASLWTNLHQEDEQQDNVNHHTDTTLTKEQQETAKQLHIDALNNITAVYLSAKQYHQAKEAAVQVLQVDANNIKGLIRAAKAALLDPASDFGEVDAALQAAASAAAATSTTQDQHEQFQKDIQQLQTIFKKRKQLYTQKTKQMYRKAFSENEDENDDDSSKQPLPEQETENNSTNKDTSKKASSSSSATTSQTTTTPTPTPSWWQQEQSWIWQYAIPYGIQIIIFLSMLLYVVYYQPQSPVSSSSSSGTERTTSLQGQEEF
jgi:hypothetical protein